MAVNDPCLFWWLYCLDLFWNVLDMFGLWMVSVSSLFFIDSPPWVEGVNKYNRIQWDARGMVYKMSIVGRVWTNTMGLGRGKWFIKWGYQLFPGRVWTNTMGLGRGKWFIKWGYQLFPGRVCTNTMGLGRGKWFIKWGYQLFPGRVWTNTMGLGRGKWFIKWGYQLFPGRVWTKTMGHGL